MSPRNEYPPDLMRATRQALQQPVEGWQNHASCRQHPNAPDWWYPLTSGALKAEHVTAIRICQTCPVQADCLADALRNDERGIWGGYSEQARRTVRRILNGSIPVPVQPPPKRTPQPFHTFTCPHCAGSYRARRKGIATQQFCSRSCAAAAREQRSRVPA